MADSETAICNMALSHLAVAGLTFEIQNLDTENSKEAAACRAFYAQARDEVLEDFPWPFATVLNQALGLVTNYRADPENAARSEWCFAYRMPSECVSFRRLLSGVRTEARDEKVPYRIGQDDDGQLIFTDLPNARGEWTKRVTDVTRFSPSFTQALALKLAFYIGPRVAGGDQYRLADRAYQLFIAQQRQARANALNAEQPDPEPDSPLLRARD